MRTTDKKPNLFVGFFPETATKKIELQKEVLFKLGFTHYSSFHFSLPGELNSFSLEERYGVFSPEIIFLYNYFEFSDQCELELNLGSMNKNASIFIIEKELVQKRLLFTASKHFLPFKLSS